MQFKYNKLSSQLAIIFFLLFGALLSGCYTHEEVLIGQPISEPPLIMPAPISVQVIYSENLLNHKCEEEFNRYITSSVELGPPSIKAFEIVLRSMFKEVEIAENITINSNGSTDKKIVEIGLANITDCDFIRERESLRQRNFLIAYKAILRSETGDVLLEWEGQGIAGPTFSSNDFRYYKVIKPHILSNCGIHDFTCDDIKIQIAMRRAIANFIINFEKISPYHDN